MEIPDELAEYVARPGATYRWELLSEERSGATTVYDLHLASQTWQGIEWRHHLLIAVPDTLTTTETASLTVQADYGNADRHRQAVSLMAEATGLVYAALYDVPNQPLFDGLVEDALIVHTLVEYLDGNGDDWPLLYPMVKSAVRAMDAVQAFRQAQECTPPERFVVGGASKRGWTSWLTAVVDVRVAGIMPQVYDNLNLFAQMPHQVEVWHSYSEKIHDYTEVDLPSKMRTPRGFHLARIIDPYTYRERLALPKLIINGSNDRYWATDALNFYWDDLIGPKHVLYVPNAGHGIQDAGRLFPATVSFVRGVAEGTNLPVVQGEFQDQDATVALSLTCDAPAREARLWQALSPTQDFRECLWESTAMQPQGSEGTRFLAEAAKPETGYIATFGEAVFDRDGLILPLSTRVRISSGRSQPSLV